MNNNIQNIVFQPFEKIIPSTKTVVAISNFDIDLNIFFKYVPIVKYIVKLKKRGRKKKGDDIDPNQDIPSGSIISIQKGKELKRVIENPNVKKIKENKENKKKKIPECKLFVKRKDYFLNSMSIYMVLSSTKSINIKLSRHGKFHMTGCKTVEQAIDVVYYLYCHIKHIERLTGEKIISMKLHEYLSDIGDKNGYNYQFIETDPEIIFNVVMSNIDFKIGYKIDREKIDDYIQNLDNSKFISLYESNEDTGINIKIKPEIPYDIYMDRIKLKEEKEEEKEKKRGDILDFFNGSDIKYTYSRDKVHYTRYVSFLKDKEQQDWPKKMDNKYHTFLCFHSGGVIFSSSGASMKDSYDSFIEILKTKRHIFEEKLR